MKKLLPVILFAGIAVFSFAFAAILLASEAEAHQGQISCSYIHGTVPVTVCRVAYRSGSNIGYSCSTVTASCSNMRATNCRTIVCHDSSSCNDGSTSTTDVCQNADTTSSHCSYSTCSANTLDLNDNNADGCEVNLLTDASNCGSVGNVCSGGVCSSGVCTDYSISVSPSGGLANAGDSKTVNASLALTSGSGSSVALTAVDLPTGASASFTPSSCTPSCYSNLTISTGASTPTGSHIITVRGALGSTVKTATYNLTILQGSGIATCGNLVCEHPETQSSCASDCNTTASIPGSVAPGEVVTVAVEFWDFRYQAGGQVKIDLEIDPENVAWVPANGCFFGGVKMAASAGGGAIAWPSGTTSEDGHFRISTSCTVPSGIAAGAHTLVATPTIF